MNVFCEAYFRIQTFNKGKYVSTQKEKSFDLKFILGIINYKATAFFWKKSNSDEKKTFPKIKKEAILSIPIPEVKGNVPKKIADEIIQLVDTVLLPNYQKQTTTLAEKKLSSLING